ncbi:MAG: gamma-glutamylcyclotransferase family protein [Meiothermus sp.]|nr:gamma-glutamylcyclotransferase family protein [Meiothermus sp.]
MHEPVAVFVYGTLKQGGRNFPVAQRAGWVKAVGGWLEGFDLFDMPRQSQRPYAYPSIVPGVGRVFGEIQWFRDLDQACVLLDELEDEGGEYFRVIATAYTGDLEDHGWEVHDQYTVWVYVYRNLQSVLEAGGIAQPEGVWQEEVLEG